MQKFSSITKIKIEDIATKATSFPSMMYPNRDMEIQCKLKYIEGIKFYQNVLLSALKEYFNTVTPCTNDSNSEIRIEDKTLWQFYNTLLYSTSNNDKNEGYHECPKCGQRNGQINNHLNHVEICDV